MPPQNTEQCRCPSCSKGLLSRIAKTCSWCGAEIPDELRLTEEEIKEIDKEHADARRALGEQRERNQPKKKALIHGIADIAGLLADLLDGD